MLVMNDVNGILIVNKEINYTSRDVVNIISKKFKTKKVGHTGTLDPIASGVLVICLGSYTKLVSKLVSNDKEYIANILFGIETDTLDITGKVLKKESVPKISLEKANIVLNSFIGKSKQEVPIYSAIKVRGKRLYEYARNNECVTLPIREIEVKEIELLELKDNSLKFRVVVSKGTYIRSLIRDICKSLNVIGTMDYLCRVRDGNFLIKDAKYLNDISLNDLKTIKYLFNYPEYNLNSNEYKLVLNGNIININSNEPYLFLKYNQEIIAIYKKFENVYKPYFKL